MYSHVTFQSERESRYRGLSEGLAVVQFVHNTMTDTENKGEGRRDLRDHKRAFIINYASARLQSSLAPTPAELPGPFGVAVIPRSAALWSGCLARAY